MADSWENQQSRQKSCTCAGRDIAPLRILLDCCKYLQIWRRSYIPGVAGKVVQLTGKPAQVYSQESYQWIYYSKVVSFKLRKTKTCNLFCKIAAKRVEKEWCAYVSLVAKQIWKRATCTDFVAKSRTTLYILRKLLGTCSNLIVAKQLWTWVVKRATSLFNSFCSNVAKQQHVFCCPFHRTLGRCRNRCQFTSALLYA